MICIVQDNCRCRNPSSELDLFKQLAVGKQAEPRGRALAPLAAWSLVLTALPAHVSLSFLSFPLSKNASITVLFSEGFFFSIFKKATSLRSDIQRAAPVERAHLAEFADKQTAVKLLPQSVPSAQYFHRLELR